MAQKRILLLGGHGKVSLFMTPRLVAASHHLTSVIRSPDQKSDIIDAAGKGPGKIDVLIESLSEIKSQADAQKVLDKAKPDWVVWSAGAGGKGGAAATYAVDRDACSNFIKASIATPSITKFLLVSALIERRNKAPWWDEKAWSEVQKVNSELMPDYYKAKLAADECLTVLGNERVAKDKSFKYIVLRPGTLKDDKATGKVQLGKTDGRGSVTREDVGDVAARLLETEVCGWIDLLNGDEDVAEAVEKVVKSGVNAVDGEDLDAMKKSLL